MRKLVLLLILGVLVFSAYSNTFESPPVLDDFHSFVNEPLVQKFDWSDPAIHNLARGQFGIARVIPMLSLANDYWRGGGDITPFHVTNLIIHLAVTLAVFFLVWLLFEICNINAKDTDNNNFYWAFFVAGLWSLSPVQTGAVTYIVQRMAALVALFYIISVTSYFFARLLRQKGELKKSWFFFLFFFLSTIAAFMSKENSFTIPLIIILGEILLFPEAMASLIKNNKILVSLGAIIVLALCFLVVFKLLPGYLEGYNHRRFDLWQRLMTQGRVVISYIGLLMLPLPRYLCLDHHVELSYSLFNPLTTLFSLATLLAIALLAFILHRKKPLYSFAIGWFLVTLVIESSFIALELKFEHRLYLPSVGFFLLFVAIVKDFQEYFPSLKKKEFLLSIIFIICSVLCLLTYKRNQAWATSVTINADTVAKSPLKARAHSNLGSAYLRQEMYEEAIESSAEAISIGTRYYEEYWVSANNLIVSYHRLQQNTTALLLGRDLLAEADPKAKANSKPRFLSNMAMISLAEGDWLAAYQYSLQALTLVNSNPNLSDSADVEHNMLVVLRKSSQSANDEILLKLDLVNRQPEAVFFKMANIFVEIHDYKKAYDYNCKCLQINPYSPGSVQLNEEIERIIKLDELQKKYGTLKNKYVLKFWKDSFHLKMSLLYLVEKFHIPTGHFFDKTFDSLKRSNPGSSDPWLLESWHYFRDGKYEIALELIDQAILCNPDYAQLWVNRGIYEMSLKKFKSAKQAFLKVFKLYPGYPKRDYVSGMIAAADKGLEHFINPSGYIEEGDDYE